MDKWQTTRLRAQIGRALARYEDIKKSARESLDDSNSAGAEFIDCAHKEEKYARIIESLKRTERYLQILQHRADCIDAGEDILCLSCGNDIPFERLMAFPVAMECIDCKRNGERPRPGARQFYYTL